MKTMQEPVYRRLVTPLVISTFLFVFVVWSPTAISMAWADTTTFTVTKFDDTADGSCDADCSLREAIVAANATTEQDTILLAAGTYTLTIDGPNEDDAATGDLDITAPLAIVGAGPAATVIAGSGLDRLFDIHSGAVSLADLTLRNGGSPDINYGGGIHNEADLTLDNVVVEHNQARSGGGIANRNQGRLTLVASTVFSNVASGNGGGIVNFSELTLTDTTISANNATVGGGGIYNTGTVALLMLTGSVLRGNAAKAGGGLANSGSTVVITGGLIEQNRGDGISNSGDGRFTLSNSTVRDHVDRGIVNLGSNVAITRSTISTNSAGGISNSSQGALQLVQSTVSNNRDYGLQNSGQLAVVNSTISENSGSSGAAIANSLGGVITLTNSTVADNRFAQSGAGIRNFSGVVTLQNTIIAQNSDVNCVGAITSNGHNLQSDVSCKLEQESNQVANDPLLGPLQENGGPTATHALLPNSPALDRADGTLCPLTDQRGTIRPLDGDIDGSAACDIGAYEFVPLTIYLPIMIKGGASAVITP